MNKFERQTMSLAAVFQAALLVFELGNHGKCDPMAFETAINSLYNLNPPDFSAVYGKPENLKLGLGCLKNILSTRIKTRQDALISRYAFDLIFLQRKLMKKPAMLQLIQDRMERARVQRNYFNDINDTILKNMADIYSLSISQFHYKIQIIGKSTYLRDERIFNKIRALLLTGIRASVLWEQSGGNRFHLFFMRNRLLKNAEKLLN